jgi:hypothetical protein
MNASAPITPASAPQHLQALERANEIRLARAAIKRRVATGSLPAAEVILDCPPEVEGMAVSDLLMSQHRWGRTRCRKLLAQVPVPENKAVGKMTERQRHAVATLLDDAAPAAAPVRTVTPLAERRAPRTPAPRPQLVGAMA